MLGREDESRPGILILASRRVPVAELLHDRSGMKPAGFRSRH